MYTPNLPESPVVVEVGVEIGVLGKQYSWPAYNPLEASSVTANRSRNGYCRHLYREPWSNLHVPTKK